MFLKSTLVESGFGTFAVVAAADVVEKCDSDVQKASGFCKHDLPNPSWGGDSHSDGKRRNKLE